MFEVKRLSTTGEMVYTVNNRGEYVDCLFPYGRVSKKGYRGVIQPVHTNKLQTVRVGYGYADK